MENSLLYLFLGDKNKKSFFYINFGSKKREEAIL
jgi:hypothetical protein